MNEGYNIGVQLNRIRREDNNLLKSVKNIRFKSKQINLAVVNNIQMTHDHSFIISLTNQLKYLGKSGEELEKIQIPNLITFGIVGDSDVLALSFKNSRSMVLTEWNFITKKISVNEFQLKLPESTVQLIIFRQSQFVCLAEIEKNRNQFYFSYYKLPIQQNSTPFRVIESGEKELLKPKSKLFKIDNNSMLGFAYPSPKKQVQKYIELYTYELDENNFSRKDSQYKFNIQLKGNWLSFIIKDIYLINEKQFYFQIKTLVDLEMHTDYMNRRFEMRIQKRFFSKEQIEEQQKKYENSHQFPNRELHNCHKNLYWNRQEGTLRKSVIGRIGMHFIQFVNNMRSFNNLYECNTQVNDLILIPIFFIHSDNQQIIGLHTVKRYENLNWSNYKCHSIAHLKEFKQQKQSMFNYYGPGSLYEYDLKILQIPLWASQRMSSTFLLTQIYDNWSQTLIQQVGDLLEP